MRAMFQKLHKTWASALGDELSKPYIEDLITVIESRYQQTSVFPVYDHIFTAFTLCPFNHVRVVILGQDPYHNPGEAHGLSFSVREGTPIPPSLKNIFKEMRDDVNIPNPRHGDLTRLAQQGVFLLNAILTVEENKPGAHRNTGWEKFTDAVIRTISDKHTHIIFLLWGAYAQSKRTLIDTSKHRVLETSHPSPLAAYRGFFGCKHFSQTNEYLLQYGKTPIEW